MENTLESYIYNHFNSSDNKPDVNIDHICEDLKIYKIPNRDNRDKFDHYMWKLNQEIIGDDHLGDEEDIKQQIIMKNIQRMTAFRSSKMEEMKLKQKGNKQIVQNNNTTYTNKILKENYLSMSSTVPSPLRNSLMNPLGTSTWEKPKGSKNIYQKYTDVHANTKFHSGDLFTDDHPDMHSEPGQWNDRTNRIMMFQSKTGNHQAGIPSINSLSLQISAIDPFNFSRVDNQI